MPRTRRSERSVRRTLLTALLCLAAPSSAFAQSQDADVFRDPEWRKRFLGSYGFLSGAEPEVNAGEVDVLRETIELMSTNPKAANLVLKQKVGNDSSAALDFIVANLDFQNGSLDSAITNYENAIKKFPDFRRAHKNLGLLRVQKGQHKLAIKHLSRAIELGDRDGRNYGLLGYSYLNQESHLAAEEAYRNAILQQPDVRDWKLGLARSLLALNKYKDAVGLFDALIEENPDDTSPWMLQANAYVGLEEPLKAAVNLEAVRMMGKAQTSSLVLLGDIYMNEKMYGMAKDAYLEVINGDSSGAQFKTAYRAADLLIRTQSFGEAGEILASIDKRYSGLKLDDELKVLTLKAKLARAQGNDKRAADLLESIVRRDGTRGEALIELASYYHSKGNNEKAVLLIERAENLEDFEYRALLEHAQFMVSKKDYAEAASLLRQALRINREARVERFLARVEQAVRS